MKNEAVKFTPEYRAIQKHYGDTITKRSGVKLIEHINEGLEILELIGASKDAMRAYCLHPLFQEDRALSDISNNDLIFSFSPRCIMLAMEYRARANDWLSDKVYISEYFADQWNPLTQIGKPDAGTLTEVKHMLIADKVQNYKDFCQYHFGVHERSEELKHYFLEWLVSLNVSLYEVEELVKAIS